VRAAWWLAKVKQPQHPRIRQEREQRASEPLHASGPSSLLLFFLSISFNCSCDRWIVPVGSWESNLETMKQFNSVFIWN